MSPPPPLASRFPASLLRLGSLGPLDKSKTFGAWSQFTALRFRRARVCGVPKSTKKTTIGSSRLCLLRRSWRGHRSTVPTPERSQLKSSPAREPYRKPFVFSARQAVGRRFSDRLSQGRPITTLSAVNRLTVPANAGNRGVYPAPVTPRPGARSVFRLAPRSCTGFPAYALRVIRSLDTKNFWGDHIAFARPRRRPHRQGLGPHSTSHSAMESMLR